MIAIITGDIINSEGHRASEWIDILKNQFSKWGETPIDWEIYRGDEFQLKIAPKKALWAALLIKALIKSIKDLDIRMAGLVLVNLMVRHIKGQGVLSKL